MLTFLLLLADTPRPDLEALNKIFDEKIECTQTISEPVDRLTTDLKERLSGKGSVVTIQCSLPDNKSFDWFVKRDRLSEIDFFYEMFRNKGFRKTIKKEAKDLTPPKLDRDFKPKRRRFIAESGFGGTNGEAVKEDRFGFEMKSCFTQTGMLAADIFYARPDAVSPVDANVKTGGATSAVGGGQQAMDIAIDAAGSMLGSNYAGGLCYLSNGAWAPWFQAISWDRTYVFIDKSTHKANFVFLTESE